MATCWWPLNQDVPQAPQTYHVPNWTHQPQICSSSHCWVPQVIYLYTPSLLYSYFLNPFTLLQLIIWPLVHTPILSMPRLLNSLLSLSFSPSLLDAPNLSLLHQHWSLLSFHFLLKIFQWFPSALSIGEKSSLAPKTLCNVALLTYPASFSQPLLGGTHTLREKF